MNRIKQNIIYSLDEEKDLTNIEERDVIKQERIKWNKRKEMKERNDHSVNIFLRH